MTRRKQYKNRLPTVLPPAPRPAPAVESVPPEPAPEPAPEPEPEPASEPDPAPQSERRPEPDTEPEAQPVLAPGPAPRATLLWEEDSGAPSRTRTAAVLLVLVAVVVAGGVLAVRLLDGSGGRDAAAPRLDGEPTPSAVPVSPGGSRVEATVRPGGDIVVTQRITSRTPLRTLSLAVPDVGTDAGADAGAGGPVRATDLSVVADGETVPAPDRVTDRPAEVSLDGATSLLIRYRLVGAVRGSDSAPGRALALATALDVRWTPGPERETRVVRAPGVLALACAPSPDQPPVPCGTARGDDTWHVDLEGDGVGSRVLAQLTVPGLGGGAAG